MTWPALKVHSIAIGPLAKFRRGTSGLGPHKGDCNAGTYPSAVGPYEQSYEDVALSWVLS